MEAVCVRQTWLIQPDVMWGCSRAQRVRTVVVCPVGRKLCTTQDRHVRCADHQVCLRLGTRLTDWPFGAFVGTFLNKSLKYVDQISGYLVTSFSAYGDCRLLPSYTVGKWASGHNARAMPSPMTVPIRFMLTH